MLKYLNILFPIYIFSLCITSCTKPTEKYHVQELDDIAKTYPDSVLTILEQSDINQPITTDRDARIVILKAECHSYGNRSMLTDTLIAEALDYLKSQTPDSTGLRARAYAMTGKHLWWKGDRDKAYAILQEGVDDCQTRRDTLGEIIIQQMIADLRGEYEFFGEAAIPPLLRLFELEGESGPNVIKNYRHLGGALFFSNRTDEAVELAARSFLPITRTEQDSVDVWSQFERDRADLLNELGYHSEAITIQKEVLRHYIDKGIPTWPATTSLARYYLSTPHRDSAFYYYDMARATPIDFSGNRYAECYVKVLDAVFEYLRTGNMFVIGFTKILNIQMLEAEMKAADEIARIQELNRARQHNLQLQIRAQRLWIIILSLVLLSVFTASFSYIWLRKRKKKIVEQEERIETFTRMLSDIKHEDSKIKRLVMQQLGIIKNVAGAPSTANRELLHKIADFNSDGKTADNLLDWSDIYNATDTLYDSFYSHLINKFGDILTDKEIQLCILLKTGFSTKEISVITGQSTQTIYQRKSVIRKKLKSGENSDIIESLSAMLQP